MPYDSRLREEALKNKVARDYFGDFDCTQILGNIDFCIADSAYNISYLWAEAKKGVTEDIYASFVQLIITIGKARTFEKHLPPAFLGAFDAEKIAFLPYHAIMDVFSQNDFNWSVTASDHGSKEFKQLYDQVKGLLKDKSRQFSFSDDDDGRLRAFIEANFKPGNPDFTKIEITRNNFVAVYFRWADTVKPSITTNWEAVKPTGIIDADFYLADLLSEDNMTIKEKLYVLLKSTYYEFARVGTDNDLGIGDSRFAGFRDGQQAHKAFWDQYKRPPKEEFWDYIVMHRDLLVPQDVRERKGSYFTPSRWVGLSQEYIARALGENWQDEYYVWDCAAGTGNLLAGLVDKYRIWASTIDQADVDVMLDRIDHGANLLASHVFRFDFLNDSFDKLPAGLRAIVEDEKKRKKLVVYINPPYAEAGSARSLSKKSTQNKAGVSQSGGRTYIKYKDRLGRGINEIFAQFLIRASAEIPGCKIGNFSKLKAVQASNFAKFRATFAARLLKLFIVPANTFDNVKGEFPIGFHVWDTQKGADAATGTAIADVYDWEGDLIGTKSVFCPADDEIITPWLQQFYDKKGERVAYYVRKAPDFQNNRMCFITLSPSKADLNWAKTHDITANNLRECAIYHAIRHVIPSTWLNDRDQYLYPADTWMADALFQTDCLAWTVFNTYVSCEHGVNHWIPFTEAEVGANDTFASHFMTDYMAGKLRPQKTETDEAREAATGLPYTSAPDKPLEFSPAARAVFAAGLALWRYYHRQPNANPDAALYDIKAHFQGRNAKGKMNSKSGDETYNGLMADLRAALKALAGQIKPKVYEHGFLKA